MDARELETKLGEWVLLDRAFAKKSPGYVAPVSSLANRLERAEWERLHDIGTSVRTDVWMETASERMGRTLRVGFRDNRDVATYNLSLETFAARAKVRGFKARIEADGKRLALYITLPKSIDSDAAALHPRYVEMMGLPLLAVVA